MQNSLSLSLSLLLAHGLIDSQRNFLTAIWEEWDSHFMNSENDNKD